jgi:hypothetical protein
MKLTRYMHVAMTFASVVAVVALASGVGAQDTAKETTLTGKRRNVRRAPHQKNKAA